MSKRTRDMLSALFGGLVIGLALCLPFVKRPISLTPEPVVIVELHDASREPGRAVQMPLSKVIDNAERGLPVTVVGVVGK